MKRRLIIVLALAIPLLTSNCIRAVSTTNKASEPAMRTDAELARIRDGFDARVKAAFEAERGGPLKRAKKLPPLGPNRGNYVRGYSWSIINFAARCLYLNEQVAEANAALRENAQHYIDHPKDINDRDSFHWHSDMLCRLIEMYGEHGSVASGRITPETEKFMLEPLWFYLSHLCPLAQADIKNSNTWDVYESENHHAQHFTTAWHVAKLLKDSPAYRDRKCADGSTVAQQYDAWTEYIKAYCTERAKRGLFVEAGSDGYNVVGTKGFYNVYEFSPDPLLRQRAKYLLDLYWAAWAQEQIDGVRGGGRARIYQSGQDRKGDSEMRYLAWFFFGIGETNSAHSPMLTALTGSYRPPLVVVDLATDPTGRGEYAISNRIIGLLRAPPDGIRNPLDYLSGGLVRYSWCTPDYIIGTTMVEKRETKDWTGFSAQNRWLGAIFAGAVDARIVPQVQGMGNGKAYNAQWSVQRKGTLICQKLKTSRSASDMRVWFSEAGLSTPTLENGWVFVKAPNAYAAVRVVKGEAAWETDKAWTFTSRGSWLHCRERYTPVILEVARKKDFPSFEAFRKAVATLPLVANERVLSYTGLSGDRFTFYPDQTKPPAINAKTIDLAPTMAFDSPFIQGRWGDGVVTITKNSRKLVLDFNGGTDR